MLKQIIERNYENHIIRQRGRYLSALDMCQSVNKKATYLNGFLRKQRTRRLLVRDTQKDFIVKDSGIIWYKAPLAMELSFALHGGLSMCVDQWLIWEPIEELGKTSEFIDKFQNLSVFSSDTQSDTVLISEFDYRDRLQETFGGEKEVTIDDGKYRIDILTEDSIIEVKFISDWLKGLKQLNIYSTYYPTKKKVLILFGTSRRQDLSFIRAYASQLQTDVLWVSSAGYISET